MKRIIFIIVLLPLYGLAQNIGIKAGITTANVYSSPSNSKKPTHPAGFNFGLIATFGKKLFIQVEPSYSKYNNKYENIIINPKTQQVLKTTTQYQYNYFSIPVLLNYDFTNKRNFGISIGAEPTYLYKVKSKETERDYTDSYYRYGVNAVAGLFAGVNITGRLNIRFHARIGAGLIDIRQNQNVKQRLNYVTLGTQLIYRINK